MSDTTPAGDVVDLDAHRDKPDLLTCECGSQWFETDAVALDNDRSVTAYVMPLTCRECRKERWT